MNAFRHKETGQIFKVLTPEQHEGGVEAYEYNRPNAKWELILAPDNKQYWLPNNPAIYEKIILSEETT